MTVRERTEALELETLSPHAACAARSRGRARPETPCEIRTAFQRDRDRIIHSRAFRRLRGKTQVFLAPEGDHYRTRLTHTLEVAQIARTIAKALRLNEDLTEAVALAHDLGHTPFGHAGEHALDEVAPGGYRHNEQSLRVVDVLERPGGLNLTWEVRDGIQNHVGALQPATLEGQVAKICDRIAYVNHDIDDAIRAGVLTAEELPRDLVAVLGSRYSERVHTMVRAVIEGSWDQPVIRMVEDVWLAMDRMRDFLFEKVYHGWPPKQREEAKARRVLQQLYRFYLDHPDVLAREYEGGEPGAGPERTALDYVSGMTDRYALAMYERHFMPAPWRLEPEPGF